MCFAPWIRRKIKTYLARDKQHMILARSFSLIGIVVFSLIACSPPNSLNQRNHREETNEEAAMHKLRKTVTQFAKQSNADISWMMSIEKNVEEPFRSLRSLYTIDLEKLWLIDSPIVFIGTLDNVTTESEADYQLLIEYSYVELPTLRLQILCAKSQLAPILARLKSDKKSIIPGCVVVSAKITQLEYTTEPEKDGTERVFCGYGRCVDIAYLGDAYNLWRFMLDTPKK